MVVKDQLLVAEQSLEPCLHTVPVFWLSHCLKSPLQVIVSQFASTKILLQLCLPLQLHSIFLSFALALCGRESDLQIHLGVERVKFDFGLEHIVGKHKRQVLLQGLEQFLPAEGNVQQVSLVLCCC